MRKIWGGFLLMIGISLMYTRGMGLKYWELVKLLDSSYLILLQNNTELRPTGGFIGSYALVSWKKGKIKNIQVNDIYETDGRIKGHVEPPEPIQEAFQLGEWRLRDANWEADFNESGQKLNWFFDKAGIKDYQIVVATNLLVFEELIKLLGGVELTDYGEVITAENLWMKAQYYAEYSFFPGSKQKKEFLSDLAFTVKEKLIKSDVLTKFRLINLMGRMFSEKQIMLWAKNKDLENIFDNFGWSGKLRSAKCPWYTKDCISESLAINEANLGVNKANCCVDRQVRLVISREGSLIKHNLEIKFKNNSNNEWGGKYKAWVRIYAPNPGNVQGFWAEVPVGEEKTYSVGYDLSVNQNDGPIELLIQKQSGIKSILMEIEYKNGNKEIKKNIELVGDEMIRLEN